MEDLSALRLALDEQRTLVRSLKEQQAPKDQVTPAVARLQELKKKVETLEAAHQAKQKNPLLEQRKQFEDLLVRRFITGRSFEIYGGVAGLYDMGPPGAAMKESLISLWRRHFVLEENLLEIECTALTPEPVLKASGHVDRFTDLMVRDTVTHDCYRADKLLEDWVEKNIATFPPEAHQRLSFLAAEAGAFNQEQMKEAFQELGIKSELGNPLSDPFPFNLMFSTSIGPSGNMPGFLRPETAQGIFVNFRRLLDFNGGKLPFGAATIGQAFRNEIAPKAGLLRVREFTLAEIEYFVHPDKEQRKIAKFQRLRNMVLPLLTAEAQRSDNQVRMITIGDAVDQGIVNNEVLGYFIARTAMFFHTAGLRAEKLAFRFRQHRRNEMAHYANDCWDAEIWTSYGWVECVGIADRSCFDLTQHSNATKTELIAYERYDTPKEVQVTILKFDQKTMGQALKKDLKAVIAHLEGLTEPEKLSLSAQLQSSPAISVTIPMSSEGGPKTFELQSSWIQATPQMQKQHGRNFIPSVIEPSFGLGRILYAILEHAYYVRPGEDEQRAVLGLSVAMSPYKCVVCPLSGNEKFDPVIERIRRNLSYAGISCKVDDSGSAIGRRYARSDEIGISFAITVDFQSLEDDSVTIRERDSCEQVRCPVTEVSQVLSRLVHEEWTWADVKQQYPEQSQSASEAVGVKA